MKKQKLKVSELVEDFDLYPRASVDSAHVTHILGAYEAGAQLPPVIVDRKSKRIVDGFHRKRAYQRLYGDDAMIDVEFRDYRNDAEMFLDAMRLNANHGRNMTSYDRTHAIEIALSFEIDPTMVATVLNMKIERVTEFKAERCAKIENSRRFSPLKRPVMHFRGKIITKEQAEVMPKLGGNHPSYYASQLIILIDNGMLDTENEALMERLKTLASKLESVLGAVA